MISERQFTDAISFVKSYRDAVKCVEQIAERRYVYNHYEEMTSHLVKGLQNKQLKVESGRLVAGPNSAEFPILKMNAFSKSIWQ
jgi:hypothetical protein